MKFIHAFIILIILSKHDTWGQSSDSLIAIPKQLSEIMITSYPSGQLFQTTPASIAIIDSSLFRFRTQPGLVATFNTLPGIRMEERSPGSYRLSIRGSLLRSPFGVRNVKVYLDEYPLTDGGGNTYINTIDLSDNSRIEVIKGPDGSLFGANTGGVVHLFPAGVNEPTSKTIKIGAGSYGLFTEQAEASIKINKHLLAISQSYLHSDGYRNNSSTHKLTLHVSDKWNYSEKAHLKFLLFYSDLYYQTPGGLTLEQVQENPRSARPATATLPSAEQQKAATYTKLFFAGATHDLILGRHLTQVINIFGSLVDFKNPFITNFETRQEQTIGARTYLEWHDINPTGSNFHLTTHLGAEWINTRSDIHNYDNNSGEKGNIQASSDIGSQQYFIFSRLKAILFQRWILEASISQNHAGYKFYQEPALTDKFNAQWMPRIASSYRLSEALILRASISKGYSTPTTAEIRPSNNQLYLNLQPEYGWNYEAGIRLRTAQRKLNIEWTLFHYRLKDAIVRHLDNNGTEFFTNAGGTSQTGMESSISYRLITASSNTNILQQLSIFNNTTWNAFYFKDYKMNENDYSNNKLTGVPAIINVFGFSCDFKKEIYLTATYNHTGRLPLNDANDTYADAYNLLQAMIGKKIHFQKTSFSINIGVDNLLNESYSLGNDINAAGGRYYNPAAKRNWIASLKLGF